jgi:hypothetical protein
MAMSGWDTSGVVSNALDTGMEIAENSQTSTGGEVTANVMFSGLQNTTNHAITFRTFAAQTTGSPNFYMNGSGLNGDTNAVTAIKVHYSTGNCTLYSMATNNF